MHKWYVVQVVPTHEKKVKKTLDEQRDLKGMTDLIETILMPTENVSEVKNGKQKVVEKRLWPGYLLVKMTLTDESWQYVKQAAGVLEFLGGETPTALSEREVQEILSELESKKEKVVQKHKFAVGDHVKIIEGVFVNFIGTVTDIFYDKGRLSVLVSIFGRDTRVDDLEFSQVEEIPDGVETDGM
jgi:transcription termination/antitermination protein NusG